MRYQSIDTYTNLLYISCIYFNSFLIMNNIATISLSLLLIFDLSLIYNGPIIYTAANHEKTGKAPEIIKPAGRYSKSTVKRNKADTSIIDEGAKLELIAKNFSFTEGPAADKSGNVYFTDQPNNKIWKYGLDGKLSIFMDKAGRANGLYFDKKGNLLACADEEDQLWSISPKGAVTILVKDIQGHRLNGPNDLWIHPNGNIYLTDPYYQRSYWNRQSPDITGEKVYCLPYGKKELKVVDDSLVKPNGIIGTPDGKYLYVADIKADKTYRYHINKNGSLTEKTIFISKGSDGMTIDNKGNIYITGNGVTVYNLNGEKIEHIDVPAQWTANVCFGGKNRSDLFITASEAIYKIHTKVKGAE